MRAIAKSPEPPSLTTHRHTPHCNYENYADKDGLRHALVTEQHGLCCYCMGRIRNHSKSMKIEHWRCQRRYSCKQLDYRNLLGACMGGEGQPRSLQHCDTRKADLDLCWNPADPTRHVETWIRYEADGGIRSVDDAFDEQLNVVLNLNLKYLQNNRKELLNGIIEWWRLEKKRFQGPVPRSRFERKRNRLIEGTRKFQPYCQVAVWWLEQRLAKMLY